MYDNRSAINNYNKTLKEIGFVDRKNATQTDYDRIGFMSGLEVHQQLNTQKKLFCNCPVGLYQKDDDYDAEVIRHMRPTMSELGEYDGTALMEFKTKKNITYRLKKETACTYEVDDTPPFPINKEALGIALRISILSKLNIVGEVHITRKQYLDGSIPTGFQRTAILGVNGEIELPYKKIRLIQLSIEEDSCREVSDIGHDRIYRTDRLGTPLIETVTEPDFNNPEEVKDGCDYIRFLNRSTGLVKTGIGAGREDVNVSCKGGTRVEIKGVSHTKWIPDLTHNESFRQWALLHIRDILKKRVNDINAWKLQYEILPDNPEIYKLEIIKNAVASGKKVIVINLPNFKKILSHFTQPNKIFADEIFDRLKVIACLIPPFMFHTEQMHSELSSIKLKQILNLSDIEFDKNDAQLVILSPDEDINTAIETVEERCKMAFEGVPNETRKAISDGTTIFERVLPGAERMYPDTDSAPIPLPESYIDELSKDLPSEIIDNYKQMKKWNIPEDYYTYILSRNIFGILKKIITELKIDPKYAGKFFGQILKHNEGQKKLKEKINYILIYKLFDFLIKNNIEIELAERMLPELLEHPRMEFESILSVIKFKKIKPEKIIENIPFVKNKFVLLKGKDKDKDFTNWVMGQLRYSAIGNIPLKELYAEVKKH